VIKVLALGDEFNNNIPKYLCLKKTAKILATLTYGRNMRPFNLKYFGAKKS
jgi:hypothetical protein